MIDLRSDTTTLPSLEMLEAINKARFGDDGRVNDKGRGEDPTVNQLEDLAAELTGKEAALLFPTGTLGNTVSLLTYCKPKDSVLIDRKMHIFKTEKIAFDENFGQLKPVFYETNNGQPNFDQIKSLLQNGEIKLLCVENSHNFGGGTTLTKDSISMLNTLRKEFKINIHMDGARLFNASIGSGISVKEICSSVDSVMFCLSKGLGAPLGSLVCSSKEFITKLRENRKLMGGGMRQAGIIAAPGIVALQNYKSFLEEDQLMCQEVARRLGDLRKIQINHSVDTNIIMLDISRTGLTQEEFCNKAEELGLLIKPVLDNSVRMVFHRDVDRNSTEKIVSIIHELDQI